MNTHPTEFIPGYVLGVLDDRERQAVAQHLSICPQCRREAESFSLSVQFPCAPHSMPAPHLKQRLMLRVHASAFVCAAASCGGWRGWVVTAMLVAMLAGGMAVGQRYYAMNRTPAQADAFLHDPHTQSRPLLGVHSIEATLYLQPGQRRALLAVAGLPALPAGSVYQIWFAQGAASAASATFTVDASGTAMVLCDAPSPIAEAYSQVMVTVEPAGGSASPSGVPLFSASFSTMSGMLPPGA